MTAQTIDIITLITITIIAEKVLIGQAQIFILHSLYKKSIMSILDCNISNTYYTVYAI